MKHALRSLALLFLAALYIHAQGLNVSPADPNGSCTTGVWVNQSSGALWLCNAGTWQKSGTPLNTSILTPLNTAPTGTGGIVLANNPSIAGPAPVACGSTCAASVPNTTYLLNQAAGSTATLPTSAGTGNIYKFLVTVTTTSAQEKILLNTVTDTIIGTAIGENGGTAKIFVGNAGTYHSIQMPFSGTQPSGGFIGDLISCQDIAAGTWACQVVYQAGTTPTTPYSTSTT